jgi:hypothetical protein
MTQELRLNKEEELESQRSNVHIIYYVASNLNKESEVYAPEFVWPSIDKSCSCASLKPAHKGRR